jgi:hypothetical protein
MVNSLLSKFLTVLMTQIASKIAILDVKILGGLVGKLRKWRKARREARNESSDWPRS